jgi:hypothetical protein
MWSAKYRSPAAATMVVTITPVFTAPSIAPVGTSKAESGSPAPL